jgi:hypothetical protein
MRDSLDARYWITWAGAALRREPGEADTAAIAAALRISDRTVRHWRATNELPPWALTVLMQIVTGLPTYATNWSGWRFKPAPGGAVLGGPNGQEWTPADLVRNRETFAHLRTLQRCLEPGAQLAWQAPSVGQRSTWPGESVPTWQQLEAALRAVVDDVLRDHQRAA